MATDFQTKPRLLKFMSLRSLVFYTQALEH